MSARDYEVTRNIHISGCASLHFSMKRRKNVRVLPGDLTNFDSHTGIRMQTCNLPMNKDVCRCWGTYSGRNWSCSRLPWGCGALVRIAVMRVTRNGSNWLPWGTCILRIYKNAGHRQEVVGFRIKPVNYERERQRQRERTLPENIIW